MNSNLVFDQNIANWVAGTLVLSNAYRISMTADRNEWFTWKSGVVAPVYCNTRQIISQPFARRAAMSGLHAAINDCFPDAQGIIGMATAGIGWANTLGHLTNLPCGYVRSVEKCHGLGGLVEYYNTNAKQVVLVDDLVASGESLLKAIQALESSGLEVIGVLSIVNWNFPHMWKTLTGRKVVALCSYPEIVRQLNLENDARDDLMCFYRAPKSHVWVSHLFAKTPEGVAA